MAKPKKDKKKQTGKRSEKLSQNQRQSVVVNVLLAKSRAGRKPSGKKVMPVLIQPPIRMIVSSGDIMNRQPPKPQLLGDDIRKLIQLEVRNPITELRQDFLSRIESRPRTDIIGKDDEMEMMMERFNRKIIGKGDEVDRMLESFNRKIISSDDEVERMTESDFIRRFGEEQSLGRSRSDITDVFEPRVIDGASIEMLMNGDYGFTRTGNRRISPTKKQRDAINKK